MSGDPGRPSQHPSKQRLHRLQFRSVTNLFEEQTTWKVRVPSPSVEKPRGALLKPPFQQRELPPINHDHQCSVPQPSQLETEPVRQIKGLLSLPTYKDQREQPSTLPMVRQDEGESGWTPPLLPLVQTYKIQAAPIERQNTRRLAATQPSKLEIPGFTSDDDPEFDKRSTFPMMVLKGISAQQGKPEPEMKSEVSGTAGAAGLVGFGNILGSILKYVSAFLIQYGFGPGGFGLYTLCLSLVNLVSAIFNLGLDDAIVRYVAIYRGKQQTKS